MDPAMPHPALGYGRSEIQRQRNTEGKVVVGAYKSDVRSDAVSD